MQRSTASRLGIANNSRPGNGAHEHQKEPARQFSLLARMQTRHLTKACSTPQTILCSACSCREKEVSQGMFACCSKGSTPGCGDLLGDQGGSWQAPQCLCFALTHRPADIQTVSVQPCVALAQLQAKARNTKSLIRQAQATNIKLVRTMNYQTMTFSHFSA